MVSGRGRAAESGSIRQGKRRGAGRPVHTPVHALVHRIRCQPKDGRFAYLTHGSVEEKSSYSLAVDNGPERRTGSRLAPRGQLKRLFEKAGEGRWLVLLSLTTLLLYLAMIPSFHAMSGHGASLGSFEDATSVSESTAIAEEWGSAGREGARTQLVIDLPFMVSYALLLAGACNFVAKRAACVGWSRFASFAEVAAWSGPIAAGCDLMQNISLALVLGGQHSQPWPRISASTAIVTRSLFYGVLTAAICASVAITVKRRLTGGQSETAPERAPE